MLDLLLSNQSQIKIFFFLLVNGKCYASQLSQRLNTPLTPLQHTLKKLEAGRVLVSYQEGKNKYFEFNTDFPLMNELQALLTRAYTHLSAEEKKLYYSPQFHLSKSSTKFAVPDKDRILHAFWERLASIQTLTFAAKSKTTSATGWNGIGKGTVDVKAIQENVLLFQEKGSWISEKEQTFEFSNTFRWTRDSKGVIIQLEHLRLGPQYPVHLFDLSPADSNTLESVDAHACKEDTYFGRARFDSHYIQLHWRVLGAKKNEDIDYLYT